MIEELREFWWHRVEQTADKYASAYTSGLELVAVVAHSFIVCGIFTTIGVYGAYLNMAIAGGGRVQVAMLALFLALASITRFVFVGWAVLFAWAQMRPR